ncbi:MAG TPA: glycosyltransferase [Candidatus Merdenecus merdavium]|nr:glycosyltransferase [Candidatus Merdenecus merdavium]
MQLKFSVLLSVYYKEQPDFLFQSLNSIFSQTLLPNEVVLVKDGSLFNELESVIDTYQKKYSNLKIISLSTNQGLGKALNEGLKYCSYDLVARMDTDDIAKSNRFEKQIKVFKEYPEMDICSSWIEEFEGVNDNVLSTRKLPEYHHAIIEYAKKRCPINHPVVMFRKSAVLKAGGYKHFPLFEDYYLWIRMLMNGAKFYNIQESLLYFRFSPEMFKRRGGWKYAMDELRFQRMMKQEHFISTFEFLRNVAIRFSTRIIPNSWRTLIYKKMLR